MTIVSPQNFCCTMVSNKKSFAGRMRKASKNWSNHISSEKNLEMIAT